MANQPSALHLGVIEGPVFIVRPLRQGWRYSPLQGTPAAAVSRVCMEDWIETTYGVAHGPVRSDGNRVGDDHEVAVEEEEHARAGDLPPPYEPDFAVHGDAVLVEYKRCQGCELSCSSEKQKRWRSLASAKFAQSSMKLGEPWNE